MSVALPAMTSGYEAVAPRNKTIDVARGIAILLVVLGHNRAIGTWSPGLVRLIFLFHVPLFFLLSGWVLRDGDFSTAVIKFTRRLLVPCFAAALVVGLIKSFARGESLTQTLVGIVWATGQTLPWSHLWFLPTLFLALVATHAAGKVVGERPLRWGIALIFAIAFAALLAPLPRNTLEGYSFDSPVGLPWGMDILPLCLIFVWLGRLLRLSPWFSQRILSPAVALAAAVLFVVVMNEARIDINLRIFTPFFAALAAAVSGCIVVLQAAALINRLATAANAFALLGRHTLTIFILHVSIQKFLLTFDRAQFHLAGQPWLAGIATASTAIALSVVVDRYLFARFAPLRFLFSPGSSP